MSQFLLWKGQTSPNIAVQPYPFADSFLNTVSEYLWKQNRNDLCTLADTDLDIDEVCTQAQADLQQNIPFENTKLYCLLENILKNAKEVVLWYGDYYTDLPQTTSPKEFFENIKQAVRQPACETYIWYIKKE